MPDAGLSSLSSAPEERLEYDYEYVLVDGSTKLDINLSSWLGRIVSLWPRREAVPMMLVTGAATLLTVSMSTLIVLFVALLGEGHVGAPGDWIRGGVLIAIASFGGVVSATAGDGSVGNQIGHVTVAPVALTFLFTLALYVGTRRVVLPRMPRGSLVNVLIPACVATLVLWSVLLFLGVSSRGELVWTDPEQIVFDGVSWRMMPLSGALTFSTVTAALLPRSTDTLAPARWAQARQALRFCVELFVATCVAAGLVLVAGLLAGVALDAISLDVFQSSVIAWAILPNAAVLTGGIAHGGTVLEGTGVEASAIGLFAGGMPAVAYVSLAAMLVLALAVGIRHAVRRPLWASRWEGLWVTPLLYAAIWTFAVVLTTLRVSTAESDETVVTESIRLGYVALLLCALSWAVVGHAGGRLVARWFAGWFPRAVVVLGGRRHIDTGWAVLLVERLERDGRRVPGHVARAANVGHRPNPVDRLASGHGTGAIAVALTAVAAFLVLTPTASADFCGLPYEAQFKDGQVSPSSRAPATVRQELTRLRHELDAAARSQRLAKRRVGPAAELEAEHERAQAVLAAAELELHGMEADLAAAEGKVRRLEDDGEFERQWLEDARQDYEDFEEFDVDGFWADQVEEAEQDLFRAEAPLRRAEAALADLRAELSELRRAVADARARAAEAAQAFAPYESKLASLEEANDELASAESRLDEAKDAWSDDLAQARADVETYNTDVAGCHDEASHRTLPAGGLLAGALSAGPVWLWRRRRSARASADVN